MKLLKNIAELMTFPVVIFLPDDMARQLKLFSLKERRIRETLKHLRGQVLDIGCGKNELIRLYGKGKGLDIRQWGEVDVVCNPTKLPFTDNSFDAITFIASLNHVVDREQVLGEVKRCLKDNGQLIITMINPVIGWLCHKVKWINWDLVDGEMHKGELPGMSKKQIIELLNRTGFELSQHSKFLYGFNNLYIAKPRGSI